MSAGAFPRIAVHDGVARRIVTIDKPVFTIGRGPGHDLELSGADVSRQHAEIVRGETGFAIRDLGSTCGTSVNGSRVSSPQALQAGDEIVIGGEGAVLIFLGVEASVIGPVPAAAAADLRHVATLLEALRSMGAGRVLDEVLALVVDAAIEATGAERGFIMLADASGVLDMKLARGAGRVTLTRGHIQISRKVPEQVFATGRTTVEADLLEGNMAAIHTGTVALGIRQVLCAPLRLVHYHERLRPEARSGAAGAPSSPRNIGVLYMDSRERGRLLSIGARTALEALATQAAIAIENARLYHDALEKARIDEELAMASGIQQALLPEARRTGPFFEAVGASIPSRVIGGDFFDYQDLGEAGFGFGLGDITGKGPAAALMTALVQGVITTRALAPSTPDEVVALLNRILLARRIEARFLTVFLAVLRSDGQLTYCNAAQNPPLLLTGSGIVRLETGGTIVGAFPDAHYEQGRAQLAPGDTVVLFSDGVAEAENAVGLEFGEQGIAECVAPLRGHPPDVVLATLFDAVRTYTRDAPLRDDCTAVVVRYG